MNYGICGRLDRLTDHRRVKMLLFECTLISLKVGKAVAREEMNLCTLLFCMYVCMYVSKNVMNEAKKVDADTFHSMRKENGYLSGRSLPFAMGAVATSQS